MPNGSDGLNLPHPIAFVMGGGGSLGASQVGMLQALSEHGVTADLIVGTSVGALNGAFLASDPVGGGNRLSHLWPGITKDVIFPGSAWQSVLTLRSSKTNLYPSEGLGEFIDANLPVGDIDELAVPFVAMATDVDTGRPVPLERGPLKSALLASAAIPGVFPPVEREGQLLYDGGLVANLPLRQALAMGAASLVLLDCNFPGQLPPRPDTMLSVIDWSVSLMLGSQAAADLPYISEHVPVLYLPGPPRAEVSPLDFDHTMDLIGGAYEASRSFLGSVNVDEPRLYQAESPHPLPEPPRVLAVDAHFPTVAGESQGEQS